MALPRVWLVPYMRGWSFDLTCAALVRHLSHRFEFRVAYGDEVAAGILESWPADAYVDMWWHGTLHYRFGRRVVKQVSSHRWRQREWGTLDPARLIKRYGGDIGAIVAPSRRLVSELVDGDAPDNRDRPIMLAQKGFEPSHLEDCGSRRGPTVVGWAGASEAPDKRVELLVDADPSIRLADRCLTYAEMGDFYNSIDVLAIASDAEGDPRPLIEAMACGCFPVSTDVGIVPELVVDGVNGIVVREQSREAFEEAFAWCRANSDRVRERGRDNARQMLRTRTWSRVAPAWGDAIDVALDRSRRDGSVTRDQEIGRQMGLTP